MKKFALVSLCSLFLLFFSVTTAQAGDWELRMVALAESDWAALKFNVDTGECYRAFGGNWAPCGEEGSDVPRGEYEVIIVPAGTDWYAVRMNTETGQAWRLSSGNWLDMEQEGGGDEGVTSGRPPKTEK